MFSTNKKYCEKSEVLRMLWGANQEFVGCPKPSKPLTNRAFDSILTLLLKVCRAEIIDTLVKLKDDFMWIFVGKYF